MLNIACMIRGLFQNFYFDFASINVEYCIYNTWIYACLSILCYEMVVWVPVLIIWPLVMLELDERMKELKNELESFEGEEYDENHKRKAVDALKRMENWNLFSDTYEVCSFMK